MASTRKIPEKAVPAKSGAMREGKLRPLEGPLPSSERDASQMPQNEELRRTQIELEAACDHGPPYGTAESASECDGGRSLYRVGDERRVRAFRWSRSVAGSGNLWRHPTISASGPPVSLLQPDRLNSPHERDRLADVSRSAARFMHEMPAPGRASCAIRHEIHSRARSG